MNIFLILFQPLLAMRTPGVEMPSFRPLPSGNDDSDTGNNITGSGAEIVHDAEQKRQALKADLAIAVYEFAVRAYFYRKKFEVQLGKFVEEVERRIEEVNAKLKIVEYAKTARAEAVKISVARLQTAFDQLLDGSISTPSAESRL